MRLATLGERPPVGEGSSAVVLLLAPSRRALARGEAAVTASPGTPPQALKKRREHGEEALALHLGLVGAFERVPRVLL